MNRINRSFYNMIQSVIFICSFLTILFISSQLEPVLADDLCGDGYTCWPSNGGSTAIYNNCEPQNDGAYCAGDGVLGVTLYCDCNDPNTCTCQIGPGVSCAGTPYKETECDCANNSNMPCDTDAECGEYGPCNDCEPVGSWICDGPHSYATIGCCYAEDEPDPTIDPDPTPTPTPDPGPLSADVKANGSDTNITVGSGQYTISWLAGGGPTSCTLNGIISNFSGSNGYTNNCPGSYQYTYSCTDGVDTATDSVGVNVSYSVTADVKANGSDTDLTGDDSVFDDYTISWSSANADSCTLNGNPVNTSDSQLVTADVEGFYTYTLVCEDNCESDTDAIVVEVDFCGDGDCLGFENCVNCEVDCGICPNQWFQAWGGDMFAGLDSGTAISSEISSSATYPYLCALDRTGNVGSDGFPITGGGGISAEGRISARTENTFVIGSAPNRFRETYSYFTRQYSLGLSPSEDFSGSADNAQKPVYDEDKAYYYHQGDLTIQQAWNVAADETYTIFVDGNLTISDPGDVGQLIRVAEGGFLAFIVSGDITITDSVGHSTLSNTAGNIEGVYVADGNLIIESNGTDDPGDKRFVGEGSFVGWTDVVLDRSFPLANELYPAELFIYRPDFVSNTPEEMKRAQRIWQETN